jgi:hypothetical protein
MKKKDYFFRTRFDNKVPDSKTNHYGVECFRTVAEKFDWLGICAELEWVHIGQYSSDEGNDLLNLGLTDAMPSNVTVYGRISNLLNTDYAERSDYSGFVCDRYFAGEQRGVQLDASYSFYYRDMCILNEKAAF